MVEQVPETQHPDSDVEVDFSPLPAGQEATSNVLEAMNADEELIYSPDPSDARSDNEDGEMEEDESGASGYWPR